MAAHATSTAPHPGPGGRPGGSLGARMSSVAQALGSLVADLDPDTLLGADATTLYADFAHLERLVTAAKTLLAPRIAASGHWESEGHRSPAGLLAEIEGVSAGQAKRTLETGRQLQALPSVEAALRGGRLSGQKAAEIADAATLDPRAETLLLAGSDDEPLRATKERCQRFRATSRRHDPLATARRVHERRSFTHWTEADGTFCYKGTDTAERGAALLAHLLPAASRLAEVERAAGREAAGPEGSTPAVPHTALRADALFLLVTGGRGPTTPAAETLDGPDSGPALPTASDLVDRPTPTTVMVRVDLAALRRGRALPGELCELDGHGPVPVETVRSLTSDAFLAVLFTEAGDIRAVSHLGRTINRRLRTALAFRDRTCVVPGCGMSYGLEIDHLDQWALGGATELRNLALLCTHHHRLKTYDGWVLERHGPNDADPRWSFTPQPEFGQEPDPPPRN